MSSKNFNKKSDDKNDKAEQQALKEAEIVAELGPNEKTRKEAERLIETVENEYTSIQEQEQEETIQATKEIGYDCIELQREAANLIPKLQERYLSYAMPWLSPTLVTEYYSRMVDNFVDNAVSATNLANNLVIINTESIQRLTDSNRDYWRVGVENTKAINN